MIAFESMLVPAAEKAGMKVPPDELLDVGTEQPAYNKEDYPHFFIFCQLQLARPMTDFTEHWDNAQLIATIPVEELKKMTLTDFLARGLRYAQ